jgi:PAS domain S-box-containing protein
MDILEPDFITEHFTELYDFAPTGFLLLSEAGNILELNTSAAQILGKDHTQFINNKLFSCITEDTQSVFNTFSKKLYAHKNKETCQIKIQGNDTSLKYVQIDGTLTANSKNCLLNLTDISETILKQDELQRLKEIIERTELEYKAVTDYLPIAIYKTDEKGDCIFANDKCLEISGLTLEEISGTGWSKAIHPDDMDYVRASWMKSIESNGKWFYESRFIDKLGNVTWVESCAKPLYDKENQLKGYLGLNVDVNERKKTEEQLKENTQFLSETHLIAKMGTYTIDIKTGNWTASEVLDDILGIDEKYEKNYDGGQALIHPEWRKTMHNYFMDEIIGKKNKFDIEYKIIRPNDKAERWVHCLGDLKFNENNEPITLIATVRDVTKRRIAEDELKITSEKLRQLTDLSQKIREEESTRIAREIHDELGQQLSSLKINISWLHKKADKSDSLLKEKMDDIIHLIDESLKTVRKIASKLRPVILDDLGLNATLEWQLEQFAKRNEVKYRFNSTLNDTDIEKNTATGIYRVCQEALNNIARYANAGEVIINLEQQNEFIILQIKDDGVGFNPAENKNTLGLLGMKERAIMLGGSLEIESQKNKGTNLILKIPIEF